MATVASYYPLQSSGLLPYPSLPDLSSLAANYGSSGASWFNVSGALPQTTLQNQYAALGSSGAPLSGSSLLACSTTTPISSLVTPLPVAAQVVQPPITLPQSCVLPATNSCNGIGLSTAPTLAPTPPIPVPVPSIAQQQQQLPTSLPLPPVPIRSYVTPSCGSAVTAVAARPGGAALAPRPCHNKNTILTILAAILILVLLAGLVIWIATMSKGSAKRMGQFQASQGATFFAAPAATAAYSGIVGLTRPPSTGTAAVAPSSSSSTPSYSAAQRPVTGPVSNNNNYNNAAGTIANAGTSAVTAGATATNNASSSSSNASSNGNGGAPAPAPVRIGTYTVVNAQLITSHQQLQQLKNSGQPFVLMFYWTLCGPCKATMPHYDEAARGAALPFYLIESANVIPEDGVSSYPTIRCFNSSNPNATGADRRFDYSAQKYRGRNTEGIRSFAQDEATAAANPTSRAS